MDVLITRLQELSEKAEYLNERSRQLVEENKSLKDRVALLEQQVKEGNEKLDNALKQNEILRLAKGTQAAGEEKSEVLRQKINEYIREIDKCLKYIGD